MKGWYIIAAVTLALAVSGAAWADCGSDHTARTKTSAVQTTTASHLA